MNLKVRTDKKFLGLLIFFGVINLLQALLTPITGDEAYYLRYAENLDWGYFDHPPMVALWIKIFHAIFPGILGIRLPAVIFNLFSIALLWKLFQKNRIGENLFFHFALVVLSMPAFHIFGFIQTPDTPLLFFSVVYLYFLDRFLQKSDLKHAVFLGIAMALVLYSKYLGILLIGFSVILLPRLWKEKWFYVGSFIGFALFVPHLIWQWQHDWVSFEFHLKKRELVSLLWYEKFIRGISGIFLFVNPLFLVYSFVLWVKNGFKAGFYFRLFTSIFLFFIFLSFFSWVQAHWISFAIPALVLGTLNLNPRKKILMILSAVSLAVILILRIVVVLPLPLNTEFHRERKNYFLQIKRLAENRKVVFMNSYQRASKYTFYTGDSALSINNIYYRKNQYDLWNYDSFHESQILLVGAWKSDIYKNKRVGRDTILYKTFDRFKLFNRLKTKIVRFDSVSNKNRIVLKIKNLHDYPLVIEASGKDEIKLFLSRKIEGKWQHFLLKNETFRMAPGEEKTVEFQVDKNKLKNSQKDMTISAKNQIFIVETGN